MHGRGGLSVANILLEMNWQKVGIRYDWLQGIELAKVRFLIYDEMKNKEGFNQKVRLPMLSSEYSIR